MKTIFDMLCDPNFRKTPQMYLGDKRLRTLETWIHGYETACRDAGAEACLKTENGLSIRFLRDYISLRENVSGNGGIEWLLLQATKGQEDEAWRHFFDDVDSFLELKILRRQRLFLTEQMKAYCYAHRPVKTRAPNGELVPMKINATELRKTVLSEGLCWLEMKTEDIIAMLPIPFITTVLRQETDAERDLKSCYGELPWEDDLSAPLLDGAGWKYVM
ncbi:MAG: hypothetical protein IJL25_03580 [Clostridia bacterium]|nr:hypothetical protein [Clostridia bacterium]